MTRMHRSMPVIEVADVEKSAAFYRDQFGFRPGPEDQPYGCRDFDVKDPDGHIIGFGQDLQPSGAGPGQ